MQVKNLRTFQSSHLSTFNTHARPSGKCHEHFYKELDWKSPNLAKKQQL